MKNKQKCFNSMYYESLVQLSLSNNTYDNYNNLSDVFAQ